MSDIKTVYTDFIKFHICRLKISVLLQKCQEDKDQEMKNKLLALYVDYSNYLVEQSIINQIIIAEELTKLDIPNYIEEFISGFFGVIAGLATVGLGALIIP
jgi:hypothetical protein